MDILPHYLVLQQPVKVHHYRWSTTDTNQRKESKREVVFGGDTSCFATGG